MRLNLKGRIVIPSKVRDQLGLRPGSEVAVDVKDGHVVVEPEDDRDQIISSLEALIQAATANRDRYQHNEGPEDVERPSENDPVAAKQRDIIRRGASTEETDNRDSTE